MAYMSEEGYNKLVAELKHLEAVERPKIVAAIAEARDKGDLSENAEYDAAKEAQGLLEGKINKLKSIIADARIIDESKLKTDSIQILNKVELKKKDVIKKEYHLNTQWLSNAVAVVIAAVLFFALSFPVENTYVDKGVYASLGTDCLFDAIRSHSMATSLVVQEVGENQKQKSHQQKHYNSQKFHKKTFRKNSCFYRFLIL